MMNERLTKSDAYDIVLVVFGLFCLFRGVAVVSMDFFMSLMQSTESVTITQSPWATGLHAVLLFSLSYVFIFQRKIILPVIMRRQASSTQREGEESLPCHLTTAFWIQMFGLYQLFDALFSMTRHLIGHMSSQIESMPQGYLWKQEAPYVVLLVVAMVLILKSRPLGDYLDNVRGSQPTH